MSLNTSNVEVGKKYLFDTKGCDSEWKKYDGQMCTAIRPLTNDEADINDVGPMWRVQFDDDRHTVTDAFDDELYGPLITKLSLISESLVFTLTTDLPYGEPTDLGDRASRYFDVATVMGRKSFVRASLIEDKVGLPRQYQQYRLHILNDIDEVDGYFIDVGSLEETALSAALEELSYDFEHGRR